MRLSNNEANQSAIYHTLNHLGHALYKNKELELAAETYIESFNIQVSIVTGDASDGLKEFGRKLSTIKDRVAAMARANDDVTEISESLGGIAGILLADNFGVHAARRAVNELLQVGKRFLAPEVIHGRFLRNVRLPRPFLFFFIG